MMAKIMAEQTKKAQEMNELLQNNPNCNLNIMFKTKKQQLDDGTGIQINVQINANERVSELIQRYRNKSGDYEIQRRFIFNAKELNPTLTCAEAGLFNNSIVHVLNTKDVTGA